MRVPGQFNAPTFLADAKTQPNWFIRFVQHHLAALKRVAQALPGPTVFAIVDAGAASAVTLQQADLVTVGLTGNCTLTLDVETRAGAEGLLEVAQDATGGRTVAFVNALTTPAISGTASKKTLIGATYNGSGWILRTLASGY